MEKTYWEKRQELTYLAGEKKVSAYYRGLQKAFEQAKKEIQSVINDFYMRYAKENKVSFAEAQKQLSRMELGELQEFIDLVNESIGKYNLKLTNMSIKARITRYQALEKQIDAILQRLYALEYEYKGKELLKEVYTDAYYRTWFNIDRYHGFHQEFAQVNPRTINELIRYPFNGADFSSRIWKQKDHMLQVLTEDITTMLVQGKNPQTLVKDFARRFNTKEHEAYRLLHTESSFIIEQGSLAAYKEDGVEKYQILATLDMKTSDICREQDGKVYDVDKATVGVNYPPFHPFCRTTTVPYYDDGDIEGDTREELEIGLEAGETTPSFPSVPKKTLERAMHDPDYLSQELNALHEDIVLQDMAKEVGLDKKPTLLSKEEMDAYIQQGNRELFRGIGGRQGEAETYVEQFKTGEYFAGKGVYGNGIYTAYGEDGMEVAKQFAGGVEKNVLRISLKKDAKIISHDALIEMQKLEFTALQEEERALRRKARKEADRIYDETGDDDKVEMFLKEAAKKWEETERYRRVLADPGRYALYKGYDAIDIPSSRFMLVLNRGKVFVQK